jgi:phospholipid N-methyltransferase
MSNVQQTLRFFGRFVTNPAGVGAVAPSSDQLARAITAWPRLDRADVVVEFGPGTGAFTQRILDRLGDGATFFAIERDAGMVEAFRRRYPDVEIHCDSVANIATHLRRHGHAAVDCIVSGLPWAAFSGRLQDELLNAAVAAMPDGGRFVTFAYLQGTLLPAGRRFRRRLDAHFSEVHRSSVVWRNLPPAFVYQCTK